MAESATPFTMVADFDSVAQADAWSEHGPVGAVERLKAAARLADLLGGNLLLTDVQVLDGTFFLAVGLEGIERMLGVDYGARLPFTVVTRYGDLATALEQRHNASTFIWSSDALLQHGFSAGAIETARRKWVEAAANGQIAVRSVGVVPFKIAPHLELLEPAPYGDAELETALRSRAIRSEAHTLIDKKLGADSTEARAVRDWWGLAYAKALATQHGTALIHLAHNRANPRSTERRGGQYGLPITGTLLDDLGAIPSAAHALLRAQTNRNPARLDDPKQARNALRTIGLGARRYLEAPPASWISTWAGAITRSVALTLLAILTFVSSFTAWSWFVAIPVVALVLDGIPWADWRYVISTRPGALNATLYLGAEHG